MKNLTYKLGFTLIELLVVVIIIAILAAIAVPQYKHAALKSRFSTVMPMAKAIADAQEVYFQGRQLYALDVEELDVTPVTAENTSVSLSQTDGYDYVMAQNSQVPGAHYIIYQKYSENYPSEIHCEAADDNEDAQWLCGVLSNNNSIGTTITGGYTTYVINGTGAGFPPAYIALMERVDCSGAEALGFTCTSDAEAGTKKICTMVGSTNICRTKTYNEDGSYTSVTCRANNEGVCTSSWKAALYDANGIQAGQRECSTVAADGSCSVYRTSFDYTYDTNGNILTKRYCKSSTIAADASCSEYSYGDYYTYDANGNVRTQRYCSKIEADGSCSAYNGWSNFNYTYDANGNRLTERQCNQSNITANGTCNGYTSDYAYDYTYDSNGNQTSKRQCQYVASNGNCNGYYNYKSFYEYDTNGNMIAHRNCNSVAADGSCNTYQNSGINYTYDANGNMLTERGCGNVDSSGNCTTYSYGYDYTYDANGNKTSRKSCSGSISMEGGCNRYGETYIYSYDDNGKTMYMQNCSGSNINTTTGECTAYNNWGTYTN